MHEPRPKDQIIHNRSLRRDGRMVHDTDLFRVNAPGESRYRFGFYPLESTIPATEACRPLAQSAGPALRQ